ncbi:MAG: hypothetical protein ACRDCT_12225, partial [Shewanella sp.]
MAPSKKLNGSDTKKLNKIYSDARHPASFSSAQKLAKAAGVSVAKASNFLKSVDTHTLHKEKRKIFPRNRYVIPRMNYLFEADLCDMQRLKSKNNGVTFLLNVIDCFSKVLYCQPLKNKKGETVLKAFKLIFKNTNCKWLQTDFGSEFICAPVKKFLASKHIKLRHPKNGSKCNIVERVNKSLKNKIFKYITHNGTEKYINVLSDIVHSYNNSIHSSTGKKPAEVNKNNQAAVFCHLYGGKGRYPALRSGALP